MLMKINKKLKNDNYNKNIDNPKDNKVEEEKKKSNERKTKKKKKKNSKHEHNEKEKKQVVNHDTSGSINDLFLNQKGQAGLVETENVNS